jgi:cyclopropane fatty-acyl-phospholipid synthase-like methyltransferase
MASLIWFVVLLAIGVISVMWPMAIGSAWEPTSIKIVRTMLEMAQVGPTDVVYDLGSGDGRIVVEAARRRQARAVGIEADPLRVLWSRSAIALLNLRSRVRIVWGNFFHQTISEATVVTLFLTQRTNQRLKTKLQRELKPGTRVISHVWTFDGWHPSKVDIAAEIYMYVME